MKKAFKLPLIALAGTCLATSVSLVSCSKKYNLNIVEDKNIHVLTTKFSLNTDLVIKFTIDNGYFMDLEASKITINEQVYSVSDLEHDSDSVTIEASKVNSELITVEFKSVMDPEYEWDVQIIQHEFMEVSEAKFKLHQPFTIYYVEDPERPTGKHYKIDIKLSTVTIGTTVYKVEDLEYSKKGEVRISEDKVVDNNIIVSFVTKLDPTLHFDITAIKEDNITVTTTYFCTMYDPQEIYFTTDDEYMFDPENSTVTIGSKQYSATEFDVSNDHIEIPNKYIDRDTMTVDFKSKIDPDWHYSLEISTHGYIEVKTKTFQLNRDLTIEYETSPYMPHYILDEEKSTITIGDKKYIVSDFDHDKEKKTIFIPAKLVNSKSISLDFYSEYKI